MAGEAVAVQAEAQGDWDLRGPDFDTALIGPVTESIIDADRLVRLDWKNGFPNWAMYRTTLAGDDLHSVRLREWVVAFAHRVAQTVVREDAYSDELACAAGWDAWAMLLANRELQPYTVTAKAVGANPKTYKRLRDLLYRMLRASQDEYWIRLGAAYRHVFLVAKKF